MTLTVVFQGAQQCDGLVLLAGSYGSGPRLWSAAFSSRHRRSLLGPNAAAAEWPAAEWGEVSPERWAAVEWVEAWAAVDEWAAAWLAEAAAHPLQRQ